MTKVHAYTVLHYGKDYIRYALQSVYPLVDKIHIVYTPHPSHGHQTFLTPPEQMEEIYTEAVADDVHHKIVWHNLRNIFYEGPHRDTAVRLCRDAGAEMVLVVDCDEVWPQETLRQALEYVHEQNKARDWLINFTHLWRSFNWCCRDQNWPVRILDLRYANGVGYLPVELGEIYHFGYAVRDKILRYKMSIHGHKNEFRPNWYKEKWLAWPPPSDCHPTNEQNFWTPEPFDKEILPDLMKVHPFYNLERIE